VCVCCVVCEYMCCGVCMVWCGVSGVVCVCGVVCCGGWSVFVWCVCGVCVVCSV
jgi:hypothetical protein